LFLTQSRVGFFLSEREAFGVCKQNDTEKEIDGLKEGETAKINQESICLGQDSLFNFLSSA
jgi:hypothetical protein